MKNYILIILAALSLNMVSLSANAEARMELIEIDHQQPQITMSDNNTVRVTGAQGMTLYIYNIAGYCIHTIKVDSPDRIYDLNLAKGCYILKVGKTARKVSVR